MAPFRYLWSSLRTFFHRRRLEEEMREELQFHLEMLKLEHQRQGLSARDAELAARRDFGGVEQVKQRCREARGFLWLQDFFRDWQYGSRTLLRSPGFTMAAILTLGLGIGANTAVFSVINSVLIEPLPFADPARLVMLWECSPDIGLELEQPAIPDMLDWEKETRIFESMGFVGNQGAVSRNFLLRFNESSLRIRGRYAPSSMFKVLGVNALHGRVFESQDDVQGAENTVVLSYSLWQSAFAGDPAVIGRIIDVGEPHRVIGVMPRGFMFPPDAEVWLSWAGFPFPGDMERRDRHDVWVVARLKPGVTIEEAQAQVSNLQQHIAEANPQVRRIATHVRVIPLLEQVIGGGTRSALFMLFGAVGFVLLIACTNVANLLLARATARRKEIVVRAALGASRLRIVRQLLAEGLLLALLGGAFGVLFSFIGIRIVQAIRPDDTFRSVKEFRFDRVQELDLDLRVLGFTLIASISTGILFALIPALQASKFDLNEALKEGTRSATAGRSTRRLGNVLLIAEVALSVVLLAAAVQMLQTFMRMQKVDVGLNSEHVLTMGIDLDMAEQLYSGSPQDIYDAIAQKLETVPGVISVAAAGENPLVASGWQDSIAIEGRTAEQAREQPTADVRVVSADLFHTLGIPILQGRDCTQQDTENTAPIAIVNAQFAKKYFGSDSPLGMFFRFRGGGPQLEIVGVVGNVVSLRSENELRPEIYLPYRQSFFSGGDLGPVLAVRLVGDPQHMLQTIRQQVEGSRSAGAILVNFKTADQILAASISRERFQTVLLGFFAATALVLATVGVYGVMSYTTSQRIHEIGIRVALGAKPRDVLWLIVGRGLLLAFFGVAIGGCLSLVAGQIMSHVVYGIESINFVVIASASTCLMCAAAIASLLPARRAMRVDPVVALRHE